MTIQQRDSIKQIDELIIANQELSFQNDEKEKKLAALIIANSDLKKAGEKIIKTKRLYLIISQVNQLIVHTTDEQTLFKEICNLSIELGKFSMSWIGIVNEKTKKIIPVAHCGKEHGYLSEIKAISVDAIPAGMGPSGIAFREGKHSVCNDIENNPEMAPWKTEALIRGYSSSIALPIKKKGKVMGIFSLYAPVPNFFDEREIALLDVIAGDISFGLDYFENEKQRIITEKELTEKEFFLRESQKVGKIGSYKTNFITGYWKSSETLDNIFGIDQNYDRSIAGWMNIIHPDDQQKMDEYLRLEVIGIQKPFDKEYRIVRINDNQTRWVHGQGDVKFDNTGNVTELIGTIQDITERIKAEEKLKETANRLSIAAEIAKLGYWELDLTNGIFTFTDQFYAIFKTTAEIVGGYTMTPDRYSELFIFPADRALVSVEIERFIRSVNQDNHHKLEHRINYATGEFGYISVNLFTSKDAEGRTVKTFGISQDITDLKKAELLLEQLNKNLEQKALELEASNNELEQFAYVASHDLQEPLRMVSSFLQLLEKRIAGQLDETTKKYIDFAVDGADRMKRLIQDLLEFSRAGIRKEPFTQVDCNEVLNTVSKFYELAIHETGAMLHIKSLPVIKGDPTQVQQLFQNLVGNALKYCKVRPPEIEVGYENKNNYWQFYVKDNGIGIDPKFFDKIFIMFQRLHNRIEYSGTGIGLSICKKIVALHGGSIWVESGVGKGSTFYFTIAK
ncbi:MAG: ATP-binding protein [Ginsengibacter sp.]